MKFKYNGKVSFLVNGYGVVRPGAILDVAPNTVPFKFIADHSDVFSKVEEVKKTEETKKEVVQKPAAPEPVASEPATEAPAEAQAEKPADLPKPDVTAEVSEGPASKIFGRRKRK